MTLVVATRAVHDDALAALRARVQLTVGREAPLIPDAAEVAALVRDADVLLTMPGHPVDAAAIAGAPRLRLIATIGTGFDNIDVGAARARGVAVTNAPGILDETTADAAFGLLIAAARRFGEAERFLRDGRFEGWTPSLFLGRDVHGATLGVVGMGRIGRAVARRGAGFGMRVVYASRTARPEAEGPPIAAARVTLDELLSTADFISLHVPLTGETRHLIDRRALARVKPGAILVNTSRGPVVDERALADALREGRLAAAGLDVYEREPFVDPDLLSRPNVVLLPHIASASHETRRRMAMRAVENILRYVDGQPLLDPV